MKHACTLLFLGLMCWAGIGLQGQTPETSEAPLPQAPQATHPDPSKMLLELNVPTLSDEAEITLLTCSPGEELYSLFGHSAMRVNDPELNIDVVFNYGTFSFGEDFYFKFLMGRVDYRLAIQSFEGFVRGYQAEKRGIIEQVLALDSAEKQAVFTFLNWNHLPDHRYYPYDFFYDNCSSRLRDMMANYAEGLAWADLKEASSPSFRNIIDRYLIYHPWGDLGIDLGLGMPCDKVPSSSEYMFLPERLFEAFDAATINGKPLVQEKREILAAPGLTYAWSIFNPIPLFWMIFGFVALITALGWRKKQLLRGVDVALFIVVGAVGVLVFFLWFITDHNGPQNNLNILWAWPLHWVAIPILFINRLRQTYFKAYGVVLLLTLLSFAFLPQMLHLATIPLMLTLLLRSVVNVRLR